MSGLQSSQSSSSFTVYPVYSAPNDAGRVAKRDELEVEFNAEMIHPSQGRVLPTYFCFSYFCLNFM